MKPCPFCSEQFETLPTAPSGFELKFTAMQCPACGAQGPAADNEKEAMKVWNTRNEPSKEDPETVQAHTPTRVRAVIVYAVTTNAGGLTAHIQFPRDEQPRWYGVFPDRAAMEERLKKLALDLTPWPKKLVDVLLREVPMEQLQRTPLVAPPR